MQKPVKQRRIRRTPKTMASARMSVGGIVGDRAIMRGKVNYQLDALAAEGPMTREEVFDLAREMMRHNRVRHRFGTDQLENVDNIERGSGDAFSGAGVGLSRWAVVITYIDGSETGFSMEELDELVSIVEGGPNFNLITAIEIKMTNRSMIGEYKKTE